MSSFHERKSVENLKAIETEAKETDTALKEILATLSQPLTTKFGKGYSYSASRHQVEILCNSLIPLGIRELMEIAERSNRNKFRNQVLKPLFNEDLLEMTIPDKPKSNRQEYRLTPKGRSVLDTPKREGKE